MEIIENKIFYSPIYISSINDINNEKILDEIYKIKNIDSGKVMSNFGGWQSSFYNKVQIENFSEIKNLSNVLQDSVQEIFNIWEISQPATLKNIWFNINSLSNFNLPHTHPGTLFSGTYYVSCNEYSGRIVFLRQDPQEHYFPHTNNEYTYKTFNFSPIPGDVVFFPSYMSHYVEPNNSKFNRVSIAFDF